MRRSIVFLAVIAFVILSFSAAFAQEAQSSGQQTTDKLIYTGPCRLSAILVMADGTNAATVTVYDNTSAAGKVIYSGGAPAGAYNGGWIYQIPVEMRTGIYVDVTGTNASYSIEYIHR